MLGVSNEWMNAYAESGDSLEDNQLHPKSPGIRLCQLLQKEHTQDPWTSPPQEGLCHQRNEDASSLRAYVSTVLAQAIRPDAAQTVLDTDPYALPLQRLHELPVLP